MSALSPNNAPLSSAARWLTIIGIGEDGRDGLSPAAARALDSASVVFGGARHIALAQPLKAECIPWPIPFAQAYPMVQARRGERVCVLASGDPFHYGVGAELAKLVPADEIEAYPQPSSFSLAAAKLGWSLPDCTCISLHGRSLERLIPALQPRSHILALSWDETTPARIADLLRRRDLSACEVIVLEALGGSSERIRRAPSNDFHMSNINPLNLVAISTGDMPRAAALPLTTGLDDALFESDGQLTKAEIRAVTLAALAPRRGELLWDVGGGSGSIGIEWMLRHPANRAIAIEERAERAERIGRNALALGVPDLRIVKGAAPDALAGLPAPDAIFIGGGASQTGMVDACWKALKSGGQLVVNAVTVETEAVLHRAFAQHGGTLRRIGITRARPVGSMHGWDAAMPVTQWSVPKP